MGDCFYLLFLYTEATAFKQDTDDLYFCLGRISYLIGTVRVRVTFSKLQLDIELRIL